MEARKAALKEYKPDPAADGVIKFDIDLYHQKIVEMVVQKVNGKDLVRYLDVLIGFFSGALIFMIQQQF